MHTKPELLELLRSRGLRLKKRLGQHYLVDPGMTKRLVASCDLAPEDTVIEIGAGLGALTDLLAQRAGRVIAVEVDRAIARLLTERMAAWPTVEVRHEDILEFDWSAYPGAKVVGAIPYHITSPIIVALAEQAAQIRGAWLAVQREVADRLAASPGTKAYGRLTVLAQHRFTVKCLFRIPRTVFFPPPDVDSAWLRLTPRTSGVVRASEAPLFFEVVRAAFGQRRKMLVNGLIDSLGLTRAQAVAAVQRAGLNDRVRGEQLSLPEFARLAATVSAIRS